MRSNYPRQAPKTAPTNWLWNLDHFGVFFEVEISTPPKFMSKEQNGIFKSLDVVQVQNIGEKAKNPCRCSKISLHKKFKLILEQNVRNQTYLEITFWTQRIIFRIQNCEKMGVDPNSCFQVVKVIAKGQNWLFLKVHFAWIQMCKQAKMSNVAK